MPVASINWLCNQLAPVTNIYSELVGNRWSLSRGCGIVEVKDASLCLAYVLLLLVIEFQHTFDRHKCKPTLHSIPTRVLSLRLSNNK